MASSFVDFDARPCARGRNRFNVAPSLTYASETYRLFYIHL